ncbi:heterokaryon incompatibility protein-domain-containing protein [Xylariaceae sp. FL0804]|nr:heterokaryon incompatibility protein-domain-containing protein [Xylariaceae sp. FL0804]
MSTRKSLSARFSRLLHKSSTSKGQPDGADQLCDICKTIGFDREGDGTMASFDLGNLGDIRGRPTCPFCRFVLAAMQDDRVSDRDISTAHDYESHAVKVRRSDPRRFQLVPLPVRSYIMFQSDVKGFDKVVCASQVDFDMIKGWLGTCESEHPKCIPQAREIKLDLSFFRCIDVTEMRVAPIPITTRYVALSYRWGDVKDCEPFLLVKGNKEELFAEGGVQKNWKAIPRTIRDAIDLARDLGYRYVWVDQMCLIQDDPTDKEDKGIPAMDLVYEQAHFTIVAGSGTHANSGLPGIKPGSRSPSRQITGEVLPGVSLVVRHEREDLVAHTEYQHRGWTFQEYYLSRRKIIFVDDTVYFKCNEKSWQELEDGLRVRTDPIEQHGQVLSNPSGDVYNLLGQLLVKYSTRELGWPQDYIHAMAGVCRRIAEYAGCELIYGIPAAALDWFILFYPSLGGSKRRDMFPSWSWSGWNGQLYYSSGSGNVTKWIDQNTWIHWYIQEVAGEPSEVCQSGLDKANKAKQLFGSLCDTSHTEPTKWSPDTLARRSYAMLCFWTVSASFKTRKIDRDTADQLMWSYGLYWTPTAYELVNETGNNCGFVTVDDRDTTMEDRENIEMILLSESPQKSRGVGSSSETQTPESSGRYFWALFVEWDDGVAERRGIGKIPRDALTSVLEPGVVWKQIMLA